MTTPRLLRASIPEKETYSSRKRVCFAFRSVFSRVAICENNQFALGPVTRSIFEQLRHSLQSLIRERGSGIKWRSVNDCFELSLCFVLPENWKCVCQIQQLSTWNQQALWFLSSRQIELFQPENNRRWGTLLSSLLWWHYQQLASDLQVG